MLKETRKCNDRPKLRGGGEPKEAEVLTGHNIVYFGPEKWDGLWRNRHQLMARFARSNKVLYVEPMRYLHVARQQWSNGTLRLRDSLARVKGGRVTKVRENLYTYHDPIIAPIFRSFPFKNITLSLWKMLLGLTLRRLNFNHPIIWLSRPSMINLIKEFDEKLLIYHVVDEYKGYVSVEATRRKQLEALERKMLTKADMVIVVSSNLFQSKRPFNEHTYMVPNGVDYQAYDRALQSGDPLPSDIAQLPRPIIGYSGLISSRLDLDLLHHLAISRPDWSIALIGAIHSRYGAPALRQLMEMKNVYFLGRKEVKLVPYYLKAFDVCLIPYALGEETQNADPLKLYEYMALGRPIVTTNFSAARQFQKIVRIADSKEEFLHHIEDVLSEPDELLLLRGRQIAAENTWEDRVAQLSWLIQSHLACDPCQAPKTTSICTSSDELRSREHKNSSSHMNRSHE
jgi:glycosyltransferase involved in cell wall biosynthesis